MRARLMTGLLAAGAVCLSASAGAADADADAEATKRFRDAFKPIKLASAAKVEKQTTPLLPGGIVTEAGPFEAVVAKLLEPLDAQLSLRDRAVGEAGAAPESGPALAAALRTLEAENADLAARVAAVETSYGEVFDAGYMESGEKVHRTRKLAAVLIPFYRTLAVRNAAVAAKAGEALARATDAPRGAWLAAAAAGDPSPTVRAAAVAALGRLGTPEARDALKNVRAADAVPAVRSAALVALMRFNIADVKDAAIDALGDAAWEVRALAAVICTKAQIAEAADALVRALEKEDGRLRQDLDDALHALFGVRYYGDAALWRKWLDGNRAAISEKAKALAAGGAYDKPLGPAETWDTATATADAESEKRKGATSSFYGIETPSRRVLFLVDISFSMLDPSGAAPAAVTGSKDPYPGPEGKARIDIVKWQLHRAVWALPKDAAFNIVVYSESYKAWQPQMTDATPGAKTKAHAFIDGLKPNGTTNIGDTVDAAFELAGAAPLQAPAKGARPGLAADTVYLMSDGNPNRGRLADPAALVEDVVARNRAARLVFHTVGIGEAAGSTLLSSLASRTGGRYVGFK